MIDEPELDTDTKRTDEERLALMTREELLEIHINSVKFWKLLHELDAKEVDRLTKREAFLDAGWARSQWWTHHLGFALAIVLSYEFVRFLNWLVGS